MDTGWVEDYCKEVEGGSKLSSPKCFTLGGGEKEGITNEETVGLTKGAGGKLPFVSRAVS